MENELKQTLSIAAEKAQYDIYAKKLLSKKVILAQILVHCVKEFSGMKPEDVIDLIEGEPQIDVVPVEPGFTNAKKGFVYAENKRDSLNTGDGDSVNLNPQESRNRKKKEKLIVGLNTENSEINESLIRFDIIFYVKTKNGRTQIIVNIECQKDEPTKYMILNRAIFYVSRLVSSQKERDFAGSDYDDIKQVYSIWICMNMKENSLSHIHLVKDDLYNSSNWKGDIDIINIVMIGISNEILPADEENELFGLIGTIFSRNLNVNEKLEIIGNEYNLSIGNDFGEDVRIMCNLSEGLVESVTKEVTENVTKKVTENVTKEVTEGVTKQMSEKYILSMYKNGIPLEQIAAIAGMNVKNVKTIIKNAQAFLA